MSEQIEEEQIPNAEEVYDTLVAPKLLEVAKICKEHGIPFVAAVQFDGGPSGEGVGKTFQIPPGAKLSADMAFIHFAAKCRANYDSFTNALLRFFGNDPGESLYLHMLQGFGAGGKR